MGDGATPVITAASTFTGSETMVSLACATEGAAICYTLNGAVPNSHSIKYTAPFYVTNSCTVKAIALANDYLNSEITQWTITKKWVIGDTMGASDHAFATSGDAAFYRVEDVTAPGGEAMRSGAIGNSAQYGRDRLDAGEWETPVKASHRFFKVEVKLPTSAK